MVAPANLPLEIWLEILSSIKRIELAEKASLTSRLVHAAAHIRLHEQGKRILEGLRFQRQKISKFLFEDANFRASKSKTKLFKKGRLLQIEKIASELPKNIVNFKDLVIGFGKFWNLKIFKKLDWFPLEKIKID